jgi:hypothetical protein
MKQPPRPRFRGCAFLAAVILAVLAWPAILALAVLMKRCVP